MPSTFCHPSYSTSLEPRSRWSITPMSPTKCHPKNVKNCYRSSTTSDNSKTSFICTTTSSLIYTPRSIETARESKCLSPKPTATRAGSSGWFSCLSNLLIGVWGYRNLLLVRLEGDEPDDCSNRYQSYASTKDQTPLTLEFRASVPTFFVDGKRFIGDLDIALCATTGSI